MICDDGNVYRRHLDKYNNWSEWSLWVDASSIKSTIENEEELDEL